MSYIIISLLEAGFLNHLVFMDYLKRVLPISQMIYNQ